MDVYYYCSYTGSPVGFILGSLAYDAGRTGKYVLSGANVPALIRKCFESGMVRKAAGALPSAPGYFVLVKKLTAKGNGGNEPADYYLSFAMVTEDEAEFRSWFREGGGTAQEIADAIKGTMELDGSSDFGFTVRADALSGLVKRSFRELFEESGAEISAEGTIFELASSHTDLEQLGEKLGLPMDGKSLERLPGAEKWVRWRKKKTEFSAARRGILSGGSRSYSGNTPLGQIGLTIDRGGFEIKLEKRRKGE